MYTHPTWSKCVELDGSFAGSASGCLGTMVAVPGSKLVPVLFAVELEGFVQTLRLDCAELHNHHCLLQVQFLEVHNGDESHVPICMYTHGASTHT